MSNNINFQELISQGAIVIDVRTKEEFLQGHSKTAINIPLKDFGNKVKNLDATKPIITCCASGNRSGQAIDILLKNGFVNVHNAGSWLNL